MKDVIKMLRNIETVLTEIRAHTDLELYEWQKNNEALGYPKTAVERDMIACVQSATMTASQNYLTMQLAVKMTREKIQDDLQSVPISAVECTPSEN